MKDLPRDKSTWGPGPWNDEPDALDFYAHGVKCAMRRGPGGHWCGYVGIAKEHPYWGNGDIYGSGDDDGAPGTCLFVHGGLTWAAPSVPGEKVDGLWWFGFDCAHAGDLAPGFERVMAEVREQLKVEMPRLYDGIELPLDTYKDMAYVKAQCVSLVKQLIGAPEEVRRRDPDSRDLDLE